MEVSCRATILMSGPINNTTTYKIKTKYGDITAYIKSDEEQAHYKSLIVAKNDHF